MSDSWETFAAAMHEESRALHGLNVAALGLTRVLVHGDPEKILAADRALNAARAEHQAACGKRRGMQVRGFGSMTLQQVCAYAPRPVAAQISARLAELRYGARALGITNSNNKSLIASGIERLVKVTAKLQETATERTGVYKRRGYVAPPGASVLVSSKV